MPGVHPQTLLTIVNFAEVAAVLTSHLIGEKVLRSFVSSIGKRNGFLCPTYQPLRRFRNVSVSAILLSNDAARKSLLKPVARQLQVMTLRNLTAHTKCRNLNAAQREHVSVKIC